MMTGEKGALMQARPAVAASLATLLVISLMGCASQATPGSPEGAAAARSAVYERSAEITSSAEARLLLDAGNARFSSGSVLVKDLSQARRDELAAGQHPFAVIVTCSDSRVPPEVLFDQALGDLFVVRVAGNVVDPVVLGSVEYAVEHLRVPLVVVMGHTKCGAVQATVDGGEAPGSIGSIIESIKPAVARARAAGAAEAGLPEKSADANVENQRMALEGSKLLDESVKSGKLAIIGAKYDVTSGQVTWF
jgi:carbonic anhydrase